MWRRVYVGVGVCGSRVYVGVYVGSECMWGGCRWGCMWRRVYVEEGVCGGGCLYRGQLGGKTKRKETSNK